MGGELSASPVADETAIYVASETTGPNTEPRRSSGALRALSREGGVTQWMTPLVTPLLRTYSPYLVSTVVGLVAAVPLAVTAIPQFKDESWGAVPTLAWLGIAYTILLSYVLGNVLWFTAINRVGANRASLYANLQPFLGAFFALVVLSEEMSVLQIVGGIVIGAGILVAREARPPAPSPD